MKASVMIVSAVVLVLVATVVGATPVAADAPQAFASADALVISVEVDEQGGWTAYFGEEEKGISAADLSSLMALMGFAMPVPVLDASMVQAVQAAGVQSLALVKAGEESTILLNGEPVSAVRITDAAVDELANAFLPQLAGLAGWLNTTELALVAYFPVADGSEAAAVALDSRLDSAAAGEPANIVDVAATISSAGQLLSVGGMNPTELGIPAYQIPLYMLGPLQFENVSVDLGGAGASFTADGEEWLQITWDADALIEAAPGVSAAFGFPLNEPTQDAISLAADWLKDTRVTVGAYVSDSAQESAPVVEVGRPVQIAVKGSDLLIEGIDTGFNLDGQMLAYAQQFGSASLKWDGSDRQLRTVVGDTAMPALQLDDDFVTAVGAATMGSQFLPWGIFDSLLSQTTFAASFVVDDAPVSSADALDYEVAYKAPTAPLVLDLTVSRTDGRVAAYGEALPLDMLGPGVSGLVAYYAKDAGPALETLSLDIGPTGISIGVNGSHASLVWDAASRDAVVGMLLDVGGKQMNLPAVATSGLVETGLKYVFGAVNQVELGVRINLTDEEIPAGSIESLARQLALF